MCVRMRNDATLLGTAYLCSRVHACARQSITRLGKVSEDAERNCYLEIYVSFISAISNNKNKNDGKFNLETVAHIKIQRK